MSCIGCENICTGRETRVSKCECVRMSQYLYTHILAVSTVKLRSSDTVTAMAILLLKSQFLNTAIQSFPELGQEKCKRSLEPFVWLESEKVLTNERGGGLVKTR